MAVGGGPVIACIEDLRRLHRRRTPRMFYDYVDSGSWTEATYRGNEQAFARRQLRQRVAVNLEERSTASTLLGQPVSLPVALAPVGLSGMQWARGEIHAARAAAAFGVPFTLSTMSICSIEEVAAASPAPFWFQLYVMRDREFIAALIDRAGAAGCPVLVLTLDLSIIGQRHKDLYNGLSAPPRFGLNTLAQLGRHPAWCWRMLRGRRWQFGNIIGHARGVENLRSLTQWSAEQLDPSLDWEDVRWVRERWPGKLVLKGIMDPEDARLAVDAGADAIVVSNHGGRQLDGAPASLDALGPVVAAVGDRTEIWMDGGIRSGQDVLKALAAGARGTLIGRAWNYGLGAQGEAGVRRVLEIFRQELDLTMAFCGLTEVEQITDAVFFRAEG